MSIAASKNAEKKSKAKAAGEQKLPDYEEDTPLGDKKSTIAGTLCWLKIVC